MWALSLSVDAQTFHKCDVNGKISYQYEPCSDGAGQAVEVQSRTQEQEAADAANLDAWNKNYHDRMMAEQKAIAEEQAKRNAVINSSNAVINSPEYQQQLQNNANIQKKLKRAERDATFAEDKAWQVERGLW